LILKGLLQKIFSALPVTSRENREQTINFSDDWQGIKRGKQERIEGRIIEGKYLRNLFTLSINNHQQSLITWQATDIISALSTSVSCTDFTQLFPNMSSK